jgi:transcriptional regulator with PAS, ATPase and Fis domain
MSFAVQPVPVIRSQSNEQSFKIPDEFVGSSSAIKKLTSELASLTKSSASVLITGESGAGKEMVSRICHNNSHFAQGPFVAVNCAALADDLLEAELFGYKKGAYTGAVHSSPGLIRQAHGGSLFLDEIGEMSLKTQAKLLRVIQEKRVRSLGETKEESVNVRFISATNRNLKEACQDKSFRTDLYYRLAVIPIHVPSLRERAEDIPILAHHFLKKICLKQKIPLKSFSKEAAQKLCSYTWPGNVRELYNVMERVAVYSDSNIISAHEVLLGDAPEPSSTESEDIENLPCENLEKLERLAILSALQKAKGVKLHAARHLGINRKTLERKFKKYDICYTH